MFPNQAPADVGETLAKALTHTLGRELVSGQDLWPALGVLADAGLLRGDNTLLGAVRLGPFRIAQPRQYPTTFFVESMLPALIAGSLVADPGVGAITAVATACCHAFVHLCNSTVRFKNTRKDRVRWFVLMLIDALSIGGRGPSLDELLKRASGVHIAGRVISARQVRSAVAWLQHPRRGRRSLAALVEVDYDQRVQSLL